MQQVNNTADKVIKVLIVDDSALVRHTLTNILEEDPQLKVIGTASDPYIAVQKIKQDVPDVITLDIEMPRMDGLTFLNKLMSQHPIPVVIISTLTEKNAENALLAMEYGAVEVLAKPKLGTKQHLENVRIILCDKIKAASMAFVTRRSPLTCTSKSAGLVKHSDASVWYAMPNIRTTDRVIAVGASTGGTEAIRTFLMSMPLDCPGIIIVQHMPEVFTTQFAKRLDESCRITVKEAVSGDAVLRGTALIAPGNSHLRLNRSGTNYYVEVIDGPLVNRHKPSVDVLFESVAKYAGKNAIGIIMTGMGNDGARGLLSMHEGGAYTIAQDEASCVVFGMPKEAIKLGAVDAILPLAKIPQQILQRKVLG